MATIDVLITVVLILIMFGIGISLTFRDLQEVFLRPKALLVALSSQMLLLPLIAFGISFLFELPLYIKIGLILLAASPGGTTAGYITYLFSGNVGLSIILTTINSVLTIFTIPLIVNLSLHLFYGASNTFHLPFFETMREIFMVTLIPVGLGIAFRKWKENTAQKIAKITKPISIILLGCVFLLKFIGTNHEAGVTLHEIGEILPYALLLNVLCLFTGFGIASVFRLGKKNQITISTESAVHNTTIAFLVAGSIMHQPDFGKVSLVYALFSFWTALAFCLFIIKRKKSTVKNVNNL